jgi:hypothetical protein
MTTISNSTKSKNSQAKTNWITPPKYLDAMRKVFGKPIILDVASDTNANRIVKALHIYTKEDDGLSKPWIADNVYCNPPGSEVPGKSVMLDWLEKMTDEYLKGHFQHGILCGFNLDTSTKWFQRCANRRAISLPDHRPSFLRDDLTPAPAGRNACGFVYFGNNEPLFIHVFGQFGTVFPSQSVRR